MKGFYEVCNSSVWWGLRSLKMNLCVYMWLIIVPERASEKTDWLPSKTVHSKQQFLKHHHDLMTKEWTICHPRVQWLLQMEIQWDDKVGSWVWVEQHWGIGNLGLQCDPAAILLLCRTPMAGDVNCIHMEVTEVVPSIWSSEKRDKTGSKVP